MIFDHVIIRYGELALKGKNRHEFIDKLEYHVRQALSEIDGVRVQKTFDRMFVHLNDQPYERVVERLQRVFGIQSLSVAHRVKTDLEAIKEGTLAIVRQMPEVRTFKISAKRIDKKFPVTSQQLNKQLGAYVLKKEPRLSVDVHRPDINVRVEVKKHSTDISGIEYSGPGGLPVGIGGKSMLLLSGGIDSPVAGYLTMKRGVEVEPVHFYSPPFTSDRAKQKVEDLCRRLTDFQPVLRLHLIHFTDVQTAINEAVPDAYRMTVMRRMMVRIAARLAKESHALALSTGESLGQVASQTLESMHTIEAVTDMPILRPLVAMDKVEIMKVARKINTYNISIRPYEDCCTVFVPKAPATRPNRQLAARFEERLDIDNLVEKCVQERSEISFRGGKSQDEDAPFQELF